MWIDDSGNIISIFLLCGLGDYNLANVFTCACHKRRLFMGYKLSYTTGLLHACMVFLHAVRRMSLDSWALGCPGSGNIVAAL